MIGSPSHTPPAPAGSAPAAEPARSRTATPPNRVWSRLATAHGPLQAKLEVNTPGDAHEQQADQVADQVLRMPDPDAAAPSPVQRMCSDCEEEKKVQRALPAVEEDEKMQAKEGEGGGAPPAVGPQTEARIGSLRGGGAPLPADLRGYFEPRLGQDLSAVRLHTGGQAEAAAAEVRARAFTVGADIAFAPGEYRPGTPSGKRLLAHELVHTVQQGAAGGPSDD